MIDESLEAGKSRAAAFPRAGPVASLAVAVGERLGAGGAAAGARALLCRGGAALLEMPKVSQKIINAQQSKYLLLSLARRFLATRFPLAVARRLVRRRLLRYGRDIDIPGLFVVIVSLVIVVVLLIFVKVVNGVYDAH